MRSRFKLALADKVALGFCFAAIAFLICGSVLHVKPVLLQLSPLAALDPHEPLISGTGFANNAVSSTIGPPSFDGDVKLYGSWLGSEKSVGKAYSPWYAPVPRMYIWVSGYPNQPDNQLAAEVATAKSGIVTLPISPTGDPAETWTRIHLSLGGVKEPTKFRIVAVDGSTGAKGWLGFSQPFLIRGTDILELCKHSLLVILATAASIVVFICPGLVLRQRLLQFSGQYMPFIWVPVPGILLLALLGLAAWTGPHQLTPTLISTLGLWVLVLYITYRFVRVPVSRFTSQLERRVLLVLLVLLTIALARASYSLGPLGELFGGQISRTLEVGERSDSRFSYNVVQLVALRSAPFSPFAAKIYGDWNFSQRGPITGLAAAPIVVTSPIKIEASLPQQAWNVFDPEGYSAYRIAMIVMACFSLITVFGLAQLFLPDEWAFFAFLVAITAPFTVHEIYYTWPKLEAAAFVLLAAYLVLRSQYLLSGFILGIGYLVHPSALVWFPCLLSLAILCAAPVGERTTSVSRKIYLWGLRVFSISLGLGVWVVFWRLINGSHFSQGFFSTYFLMADNRTLTVGNWIHSRFDSLVNTLVPLNLFIFHRAAPALHSISIPTPSTTLIPFFFQYWNTLPFGAGIGFFFCLLVLVYLAFRRARAWLLLVFVIPFMFFAAYWGWSSLGLLREGLHAWFLGLMIFAVVIWKKYLAHSWRFWQIAKCTLSLRAFEILLMLLLPSTWSQHKVLQGQFAPTDVLALLTMFASTAGLGVYIFRVADRLSSHSGAQRLAVAVPGEFAGENTVQ